MADAVFSGFTKSTLDFYSGIGANNHNEWFESHREAFMADVVEPSQAFIEALGERLQETRPEIQYSPNHTGRGSFKRIHTDQRFQKGRDPFKSYCQIIFWEGPLKTKKSNSCLTVHFDPTKVVVATGLKYFEGPTLKAYRNRVIDPEQGGRLADLAGSLTSAGFEIGGLHYKRGPRGYDPEHQHSQLLRHNAIYAHQTTSPVPTHFFGTGFVDFCASFFEQTSALHAWCVDLLEH